MSFFEELKRRNVIRVAIAYAVTTWLLLQVADVVLNNIGAPAWVFQAILLLLGLGFPLVLIFSWVFEITPEGIRREADIEKDQSIVSRTAQKLDRAIIIVLVLAVGYFAWESRFSDREMGSEPFSEQRGVQDSSLGAEQSGLTPASPLTDEPGEPSIAVLPFADMSPDKDQEYFSDGIAEELLNLLVRVDGLEVASRTSSFSYKNTPLNIAEIAEELQVDHILEGSVRKADNQVRITAQLIDAATDRHLWSDTYDRELEDIFAIQDEIANAIVNALRSELGIEAGERAVHVEAVTENLDAYELYLQARGQFIEREDLPGSIALFERAVSIDPEFARAWADLAANYSVMNSWRYYDRDYTWLAEEAAQRAIGLNPELSTPWAVQGQLARDVGDFIAAMQHFGKAIELDPRNATQYLWRGISNFTLGFHDEAIRDLQQCLDIDPLYENCRRHLSTTFFILNNNEQGLQHYREGARRGWYGKEWMLFQRLTTLGHDLLVERMVWDEHGADSSWPGQELLEALAKPESDHTRALEKILAYIDRSSSPRSAFTSTLAIFRAWHLIEPSPFNIDWIWLDENRAFRESEYFKPWTKEVGLEAYWLEHGFPPACRPLGGEDFECD